MEQLANILAPGSAIPHISAEVLAEMSRRGKEAERLEAERAKRDRLAKARIPSRYRGFALGRCHPTVIEYAEGLQKGGSGWLLLTGANGRGKTTQAASVLESMAARKRVEFASMQGILEAVKGTFGRRESEQEVVTHYRNVPVLLIDDFGKENATEWSLPVIFGIIDGRYSAMKPTLFTTNMNSRQMVAHMATMGDRTMAESVVSRLCSATCVEIVGRDMRYCHA